MTRVQAMALGRAGLHELSHDFPEAYRAMRRATLILALRRKIMVAFRNARDAQTGEIRQQDFINTLLGNAPPESPMKESHPEDTSPPGVP